MFSMWEVPHRALVIMVTALEGLLPARLSQPLSLPSRNPFSWLGKGTCLPWSH